MRDAEDGDDLVGSGDLDFRDEGFDESLAHGVGASVGDLADVVRDPFQPGGWDGVQGGREGVGEFVSAAAELLFLTPQVYEAFTEIVFVEGAALERGEVAVHRGVGLGQLGGDRVQFCSVIRFGVGLLLVGVGDGLVDQVVFAAVEIAQRVEYSGFQAVGVEAFGVAGAVSGAGEAGVVAVGFAASGGAGADHGLVALRAAQEPGEVVVGAVGGAVAVVLAAFVHDAACFGEGRLVRDGLVAVCDGDLPEGEFAEVDAVAQDP